MGRKNRKYGNPLFKELEVLDIGSEGKAIAKHNDLVVFITNAIPGDIVDVRVSKKKKNYMEGRAVFFHKHSELTQEAFCEHFELCGGCRWQHLPYEKQLFYKEKQVRDNLERIGKVDIPEIRPIVPSDEIKFYRNKLEFTFSTKRWLTKEDIQEGQQNMNGLGYHMPGQFDRILDIQKCYLQVEPSNAIRLAVKEYALEKNLDFYTQGEYTGFLRNIIIRTTTTGDLMVVVIFQHDDKEKREGLLSFINNRFPEITSLMYIINPKTNDSLDGLEAHLFAGNDYIIDKMEDLQFKMGALSFYQTNASQALKLYQFTREYADIQQDDIVYDLYTGTGTIANFVTRKAKKVIGVEYIPEAVKDAEENSRINNINNTAFFAGDMAKVLTKEFIDANGKPNVIIVDPPRAGMHPDVVKQIMKANPEKVVYVSCNPATQARDIALMDELYKVEIVQPVDMFPHTHHVENIVSLKKREQ